LYRVYVLLIDFDLIALGLYNSESTFYLRCLKIELP